MFVTPTLKVIAQDLQFPEGPIWMNDGSLVVVEIKGECLTHILPSGEIKRIPIPGGPNGAACGPDGRIYICNNGGLNWKVMEINGQKITVPDSSIPLPSTYQSGSIQALSLATSELTTLFTQSGTIPLRGPNDLAFDPEGGLYVTDIGKVMPRVKDRTGVFYVSPGGNEIKEVAFPLEGPNGIALSPDNKWLYVAETPTARLYCWEILAPGTLGKKKFFAALPDECMFDSLKVDSAGNVLVATVGPIGKGGLSVFNNEGALIRRILLPDGATTNLCFGGKDLKTAFVTLGMTGKLVSFEWDFPGLPLHFNPYPADPKL